jgi:hypothetical protein
VTPAVTQRLACGILQEMRLKMDEDLEKRAIDAMPVVSSLGHPIDKNLLSTINKNAY